MLDKSLTYAWQSWHLHCVFGRHADGWRRTAKTVRRVFLTMMLLSSVSEEVYFPCHFVELPLIELLSHVLSEGINKIKVCECLWRHAWPFCDRHASRNVVAKTVRRGWRFLSVFIVCGRLWQNKGNENHMKTLFVKTSQRIKSGLMIFDVVCIQLISFRVLCFLVWSFLGN